MTVLKLQELAFTQWVTADDWNNKYPEQYGPDEWWTPILFNIVNPTSYPLTINSVSIQWIHMRKEVTFAISQLLPPNGKFSAGFNIDLPDAKIASVGRMQLSPVEEAVTIHVSQY